MDVDNTIRMCARAMLLRTGNKSVIVLRTAPAIVIMALCEIKDTRYKSIYWQPRRLDCHIHNTQNNAGIT